jgi:hypothetical protein
MKITKQKTLYGLSIRYKDGVVKEYKFWTPLRAVAERWGRNIEINELVEKVLLICK